MKYRVTGIYKYETEVDTENQHFKIFKERELDFLARYHKKLSDSELTERYAQKELNDQIIDDDGRSNLTASWLDWTVEKAEGK
jgi:hypothetical protein